MFQLQVLKKEQLYRLAAQQRSSEIPLLPKRGVIYDRNGNELAVSLEVDSVYAEPKKIVEVERTVRELSKILRIDSREIQEGLRKKKSFVWIQRKISPQEAESIKALRLSGVNFLKENKRFYPHGPLAAHVVGFVGLDSKGLEGIEFQYDGLLNGKPQIWMIERDAMGRGIILSDPIVEKEEHYRNIVLTLDSYLQRIVEVELGDAIKRWQAKGGMAIMMEPKTGKVLAMASFPSFNPNQFLNYRPRVWMNKAITDTFEPGSMFKVFLAASALEEKVVQPSDSFYCENGTYTVYDRTIRDHSPHGWLTFKQILKVSSNIGASKVAEKMGRDRFYRYIREFGFGEKTRVGLPGEAKGILHHPRYWSPVSLNTISFGQGISVTGIQLAVALCTIANGGKRMKPYIVERITNEKGEAVQTFQPQEVKQVISEGTSKTVISLLKGTTEKGGTGEQAVPRGYEVAGKTGTAQKVDSLLGGYSPDHYMSGFMGMAPVEDPKIVVVIVIDEPRGSNFGGVVAAPVFRAIVEKSLPYLHVLPKGTLFVRNEIESLEQNGNVRPSVEKGRIGEEIRKMVMPDLTGLSMRSALSLMEGKGLIIKISGSGRVTEQSPKAGTVIEKGEICYLKLESPS
ncbi:MAG: penicillin-binding protein [Thermodesulfobacteriota bacterium]